MTRPRDGELRVILRRHLPELEPQEGGPVERHSRGEGGKRIQENRQKGGA